MMHHHWGKTKRDERLEQPIDSDRNAKLKRRSALLSAEGGLCCARSPDEHSIWRSEVRRNGAAGDDGNLIPDCLFSYFLT